MHFNHANGPTIWTIFYLFFLDFFYDCILHSAGCVDSPLEALLHAGPRTEQDEQVGLELCTAIGSLIQQHSRGQQHCTLNSVKSSDNLPLICVCIVYKWYLVYGLYT